MTTVDEIDGGPRVEPARTHVVGIGASAGGLSAMRSFLRRIPAGSRMAIVFVAHLSGTHDEAVVSFLQSHSLGPVTLAVDGVELEPDHVYVAPSSVDVICVDHILRLVEPSPDDGGRAPVDRLFRSLASVYGKEATGILLSGTGVDGALGLKRIKEQGGLAIVQDPDDAEYDAMPRNALSTGLVDLIATAPEIAQRLLAILKDPEAYALDDAFRTRESVADTMRDILTLLRLRCGHDFSLYKRATLLRRVGRRMQVCETENIGDYLQHLRAHPAELGLLLRDFLISVTNFFRDPEAFAALAAHVLPKMFAKRGDPVRIWVAGCATGEEAYSLAILCAEYAARVPEPPQVQIFATDIDEDALAEARAGRYPETIAADLSPAQLEQHFVREGNHYRVRKEIREMVLFSPHNVLRDPPFSKLDLVSCRNLLIYLNREAQDRVLGIFHFALRPDGHLLLGSSESAETAAMMFAPVDPKNRIYGRRPASSPVAVGPLFPTVKRPIASSVTARVEADRPLSFGELHHRLVEAYAPPSILVNEELDIVHVSEHAGRFLSVAGGEPTRNLLRLVHEELRLDLRAAVYAARQPGRSDDVRRVRVTLQGKERLIELVVRSFDVPELARGMLLILFQEREAPPLPSPAEPMTADDSRMLPIVHQLEEELLRTREQLRGTVEQYETSVEELKASNEELHAINEELRSATEELETSKEELQSVNEELTTLNHELKEKVDETSRANSDLQNLMTSTEIGVVFLDRQLHIKRFTPRAQDLFNVIVTDIGRPLAHLTHRLEADDLPETAGQVLRTLRTTEREVRSRDGKRYLVRIHPYRSLEDRIDGVVLTFLDVTDLKRAEASLAAQESALRLAERAAEAGMWELETGGVHMSLECLRLHGIDSTTERLDLEEWMQRLHRGDRDRVRGALEHALEHNGGELSVEYRIQHATKGVRWLWATGRALTGDDGQFRAVGGITIDITTRRRTEAALRASEERFRLALRTAPVLMLNQDRDLRYTWGYMLGGSVEFIGKTDDDLFPTPEAALLTELKREVIASGIGRREELALTVGGRVHYYDYNVEPIRHDGEVTGVSSAAVDVTASKLAELALRDADRRKDELLGTLSHELRNPLAPLVAALEVQRLAGDDLPRIMDARAMAERQVKTLTHLVDDLLDVARITQGKVPLRIERVALAELVQAARSQVASQLAEAELDVVVELPATPIHIDVDPVRMTQVLGNLLGNAAKYTPRGGRVTIRAEVDDARGVATISVGDDGAGIDGDLLPHVFDMYVHADPGRERGIGGLGIGLALVRRLVELHGGTVEARSDGPGTGSEFVIRIPMTSASVSTRAPSADRVAPATPTPRKVLVVDDNRDITEAVSDLLRMMGHDAATAHDGRRAVEVYDEYRPDVILLDIGLPGIDGYEVARRVRQLPGGKAVVIVAVTGWGQPQDEARTAEAGFDYHLVKPAGLVTLRDILGEVGRPRSID